MADESLLACWNSARTFSSSARNVVAGKFSGVNHGPSTFENEDSELIFRLSALHVGAAARFLEPEDELDLLLLFQRFLRRRIRKQREVVDCVGLEKRQRFRRFLRQR